jgi:hypothetical protein
MGVGAGLFGAQTVLFLNLKYYRTLILIIIWWWQQLRRNWQ